MIGRQKNISKDFYLAVNYTVLCPMKLNDKFMRNFPINRILFAEESFCTKNEYTGC